MNNEDFAKRIAELRKERGLSQKELGSMLGVSNKAVSKWENGESLPKTATLIKMSELFDFDIKELMGLDGNDERVSEESTAEIDKLKSENAVLSTRLDNINKRRKRILVVVACLCAVGIVVSGIITFCFYDGGKSNSDALQAGEEGTKIVYCSESYVPATDLQRLLIKTGEELSAERILYKNALYCDKASNESKVIVSVNPDIRCVGLKVGKKTYYYCPEKTEYDVNKIISPENIYSFELFFENDVYESYTYTREYDDNKEFIKKFCDFYNNKPKPVDKATVEKHLQNGCRVNISFSDFYDNDEPNKQVSAISDSFGASCLDIGWLYFDGKEDIYFLDSATGNIYKLDKELIDHVNKN